MVNNRNSGRVAPADPRSKNKLKGGWGELAAARWLERQGCVLLARNFRSRRGEIDLIAVDGDFLAFVEVKLRTGTGYGMPSEAVTSRKAERFRYTAQYFLLRHPELSALQPRMDIIELLELGGSVYIRHDRNAF